MAPVEVAALRCGHRGEVVPHLGEQVVSGLLAQRDEFGRGLGRRLPPAGVHVVDGDEDQTRHARPHRSAVADDPEHLLATAREPIEVLRHQGGADDHVGVGLTLQPRDLLVQAAQHVVGDGAEVVVDAPQRRRGGGRRFGKLGEHLDQRSPVLLPARELGGEREGEERGLQVAVRRAGQGRGLLDRVHQQRVRGVGIPLRDEHQKAGGRGRRQRPGRRIAPHLAHDLVRDVQVARDPGGDVRGPRQAAPALPPVGTQLGRAAAQSLQDRRAGRCRPTDSHADH
ncbi:hypothetical protein [Nonomuraea sp. NPDC049725]|uniref:hypothetical protein n=1 Tax=Nonomuraea sp. NPDC049725 TaxID=3154508 RepID=UPI0034436C85